MFLRRSLIFRAGRLWASVARPNGRFACRSETTEMRTHKYYTITGGQGHGWVGSQERRQNGGLPEKPHENRNGTY